MPKPLLTRRELIASTVATGAVAALPPPWARNLLKSRPRVGPGGFLDGVASGEPTPDAITLWSRLTTERPRSGARVVVATDPGMRKVVATTIVPTGSAVNGALKVRIGGLRPATQYFYLFESGSGLSPVGRTRTAPAPGSADVLRMGYSSCQQYASGHYGAHAHAAGLPLLDAVLFLGDYIYERPDFIVRDDRLLALDLPSYRAKYQLYRTDPSLRELHRLHPSFHLWDDHEVANNYSNNDPPALPVQRAAAYRAAFEWLPRMSLPYDRHRIYKRFSFGSVADLFLLDERQYRQGQRDGLPRKMLGDAQLGWLIEGLRASTARWKIVAQEVVVANLPLDGRVNGDAWDGFQEERAVMLGEIERYGIENVVFLSGDQHVFMANLLASDFEALGDGSTRRPAAVEYVGGSITSPGREVSESTVRQSAPWNQQYNGSRHGYAYLELNLDRLLTEYRANPVWTPQPEGTPFERFTQVPGTNLPQREKLADRRSGRRA